MGSVEQLKKGLAKGLNAADGQGDVSAVLEFLFVLYNVYQLSCETREAHPLPSDSSDSRFAPLTRHSLRSRIGSLETACIWQANSARPSSALNG